MAFWKRQETFLAHWIGKEIGRRYWVWLRARKEKKKRKKEEVEEEERWAGSDHLPFGTRALWIGQDTFNSSL
jgi:hypothetical protein